MSEVAGYTFFSSVRRGLATAISSPARGLRPGFKATIAVNTDRSEGSAKQSFDRELELYGPGDVIGFDPGIVVRTDPLNNVGDFEPNYFPMVEFAEPDYPWRFTGDRFDDDGNLKPWIVLVVLVAEDVSENKKCEILSEGRNNKTQVPYVKVHTDNLPDLNNSHRWAHSQVAGNTDMSNANSDEFRVDTQFNSQNLQEILRLEPYRAVSRLVCPRRLRPGVKYVGLVVPTFKLGLLAAKGIKVSDNTTALTTSWDKNNNTEIELPYYYRWEFRTGMRGDFEHLVRMLEPRGLEKIGLRPMDCSNLGYDLKSNIGDSGIKLDLEGAIQSQGTQYTQWGVDADEEEEANDTNDTLFMNALAELLAGGDSDPPWVVPPIYGCWHYGYQEGHNWKTKSWINHLNLDPRHRAAAGLGAEVIRKNQEALMASAWNQLGDIETVNEILRRAQLAREVSGVAKKQIDKLPAADYLRMTQPLHNRLMTSERTSTVQHEVTQSRIRSAFTDPAFRKITRKRGVFCKRQKLPAVKKEDVLLRMNSGSLNIVDALLHSQAMVGIDSVTGGTSPRIITTPVKTQKTGAFKYEVQLADEMPGNWEWKVKSPEWIKIKTQDSKKLILSGTPRAQRILEGKRISDEKKETLIIACEDKNGKIPGIEQKLEIVLVTRKSVSNDSPLITRIEGGGRLPDRTATKDTTYWRVASAITKQMITQAELIRPEFIAKLSTRTPTGKAVKKTMETWLNQEFPAESTPAGLKDLNSFCTNIKKQLEPAMTIVNRAKSKAVVRAFPFANQTSAPTPDALATIKAAPDFPQPMYASLAVLSAEHVLPGLESIPQNTVALLETNTRFMEAFMCGLNHEFARELLWRGYPTDRRGSCFRQFWDVTDRLVSEEEKNDAFEAYMKKKNLKPIEDWSDQDKRHIFELYGGRVIDLSEKDEEITEGVNEILHRLAIEEYLKDIKPLHQWTGKILGQNGNNNGDSQLILLIRGDLLKKYPNTVIYAVDTYTSESGSPKPNLPEYWKEDDQENQAKDAHYSSKHVKYPIFGGRLLPDIAFMGFDLNEDDAREKWYFVIEQRIGEPRFGLDVPENKPFLGWDSLAWNHFGLGDGFDKYLNEVPLTGTEQNQLSDQWCRSAATIADTTLQKSVRITIHGSQLLPDPVNISED
ncbi:MAG: hypothetical protein ABIK15_09025 [Pseudomonadota bacterium]